jgi:diaminopimelate decarboxylase
VPGFSLERGRLTCDGVPLETIARSTGTPVHVYSAALIAERYRALDRALAGCPHRLHYAIKANATLGVLRLLRGLGAAADANSAGEIEAALGAGFGPAEIVFTGVGKTPAELERAVALDLFAINAESPGEIDRIDGLARARGARVRVAVRINPDVDAESHPHISTGIHSTKFGIPIDQTREVVRQAATRSGVEIVGLHVHIGSQIASVAPFVRAVERATGLARALAADGIRLQHLDLGGGLGIAYQPDQPMPSAGEYAGAIVPLVRASGLTALFEPGRWIVGPAGALVAVVVDVKRRPQGGSFVVVDAGMTECLRPALYGAWHSIEPVAPRAGDLVASDVVGPVCETADTLGANRALPPLEVGDLVAVRDTGAYAAVMASNYNRRPTAAEVLVIDGRWQVIRRRQTVDDLFLWDV